MLSQMSQIVSVVSSLIFLCIFTSMSDHERREGLSWSLHACMFWPSSQASSPDKHVDRGSNGDHSPSETASCQCGQSGAQPGPGSSLCGSWVYTTCNHHPDNLKIISVTPLPPDILVHAVYPANLSRCQSELVKHPVHWRTIQTFSILVLEIHDSP